MYGMNGIMVVEYGTSIVPYTIIILILLFHTFT